MPANWSQEDEDEAEFAIMQMRLHGFKDVEARRCLPFVFTLPRGSVQFVIMLQHAQAQWKKERAENKGLFRQSKNCSKLFLCWLREYGHVKPDKKIREVSDQNFPGLVEPNRDVNAANFPGLTASEDSDPGHSPESDAFAWLDNKPRYEVNVENFPGLAEPEGKGTRR